MSEHAHQTRSRVIVAVGPTATDPVALAAAARLARAAGAEFTALFVEDINLLRLAESTFGYEICALSGISRRLAAPDLERAFKSQADELRRSLHDVAEKLRLDMTFAIARGHPLSVLLEASAQEDLVVLANAAVRTLTRSSVPAILSDALLAPRPAARGGRPQPVAAALHSAASARRVLDAAAQLAQATAADLVLLLAEPAASDAELTAILSAWMGNQRARTRVETLPALSTENVARLIAGADTHALFWPGDSDVEATSDIGVLLNTIGCPLIVVR